MATATGRTIPGTAIGITAVIQPGSASGDGAGTGAGALPENRTLRIAVTTRIAPAEITSAPCEVPTRAIDDRPRNTASASAISATANA